ncbi:MAG: type II secretion system major pseudopilin GspG [Candidatus Sumerlaeaceae bacterium]|nr:type II secretion system major pseudopilin GspG [Candidatus Sumerlaeaceae bacterium]
MKTKRCRNRGFTFIEIMIVVVIIGIIMSAAVPRMLGQTNHARTASTQATLSSIVTALGLFEAKAGRLPTTEEGLGALVRKPTGLSEDEWAGKLFPAVPCDAWKEEFVYRAPGDADMDYDLLSKGPDKVEKTGDDISLNLTKDAD